MAVNKTIENKNSVEDFINSIEDEGKKTDAHQIVEIFTSQTGFDPKMWGSGIIGFGSYHYKYESGREGDAPIVSFAPRKDAFALYLAAFENRDRLLEKLGKYKTGKGCIYIKKLTDINIEIFREMIDLASRHVRDKHS
jgi:hypothetical protein